MLLASSGYQTGTLLNSLPTMYRTAHSRECFGLKCQMVLRLRKAALKRVGHQELLGLGGLILLGRKEDSSPWSQSLNCKATRACPALGKVEKAEAL